MAYFFSQTKNKPEQSGLCSDVARPEGWLRLALPVLAAQLLRTSRLKTCRWHVFSTPLTLSGFESLQNKKVQHPHEVDAVLYV